MGQFLRIASQTPDSVISSSAVRARTTVEIAAKAGRWDCPVRVTRALYEAAPFTVLEEVSAEPDTTQTLLLAGHQPTWSELASMLVGGGVIGFPTATMARIDFDVDAWRHVSAGAGVLTWVIPPKTFTKGSWADLAEDD